MWRAADTRYRRLAVVHELVPVLIFKGMVFAAKLVRVLGVVKDAFEFLKSRAVLVFDVDPLLVAVRGVLYHVTEPRFPKVHSVVHCSQGFICAEAEVTWEFLFCSGVCVVEQEKPANGPFLVCGQVAGGGGVVAV